MNAEQGQKIEVTNVKFQDIEIFWKQMLHQIQSQGFSFDEAVRHFETDSKVGCPRCGMSFGPEAIGRAVMYKSSSATVGAHPAIVRLAQDHCPTEGCSGDHLVIVWSPPPQKVEQAIVDPVKSIREAIIRNDLQSLKTLIENDPDLVFSKNSRGETPLHLAAEVNNKLAAELLLGRHADVHAKDKDSNTPLHAAAANHGSRDVAELLLLNKADVNAQTDMTKSTPLDYAILYHLEPLVKLLLGFGANVNIKGYRGGARLFMELWVMVIKI